VRFLNSEPTQHNKDFVGDVFLPTFFYSDKASGWLCAIKVLKLGNYKTEGQPRKLKAINAEHLFLD